MLTRSALTVAALSGLMMVAPHARAQTGACDTPQAETLLDVNDVRARIFNNGNLFFREASSGSGYEVPAGSGVGSVFAQGFFVVGLVGGEPRAAGARYGRYEYWSGPIDPATAAPPSDCSQFDRIYSLTRSDIAQYEATGVATADLEEWPTGWVPRRSAQTGIQST